MILTILAIVAGVVIGAVLNGAIITIAPTLIPAPAGVDMTTAEGITAALPLLRPRHFVGPFLAHALGTLVGAFIAAVLAKTRRNVAAYAVGGLFLIGGIAACFMIPAPLWFMALDLIGAYIPMAWLGLRIANALAFKFNRSPLTK